jgi:hypothetical protein
VVLYTSHLADSALDKPALHPHHVRLHGKSYGKWAARQVIMMLDSKSPTSAKIPHLQTTDPHRAVHTHIDTDAVATCCDAHVAEGGMSQAARQEMGELLNSFEQEDAMLATNCTTCADIGAWLQKIGPISRRKDLTEEQLARHQHHT